MPQNSNNKKFHQLRKRFPYFIYESYSVSLNDTIIEISYKFNLADKYYFNPLIRIPIKAFFRFTGDFKKDLNNIVFHIGMIELISYWKAACPPKVLIKPHCLKQEQISWWEALYFNGLGEFFFVNDIDTSHDTFMEITANEGETLQKMHCDLDNDIIIPVGGGKDSVVTLELLSQFKKTNSPLVINPGKASWSGMINAGYKKDDIIEVYRIIHPQLLKLNDDGFLNGHTPFSALLAFVSALTSILSGKRNIALSNESSANEATVPGTMINHQFSKSFEFESDFRDYLQKFICPDINYFSFLRPVNELQIAKLFSRLTKHFFDFKSCNRGSKTDSWCGKCSKCLFTYIILSPFLEEVTLLKIFGKNLLDDKKLLRIFNELIGCETNKPFECVGTIDDVNAALCLTLHNNKNHALPYLMKYYKELPVFDNYYTQDWSRLENQFEKNNSLPGHLKDILIKALCLKS